MLGRAGSSWVDLPNHHQTGFFDQRIRKAGSRRSQRVPGDATESCLRTGSCGNRQERTAVDAPHESGNEGFVVPGKKKEKQASLLVPCLAMAYPWNTCSICGVEPGKSPAAESSKGAHPPAAWLGRASIHPAQLGG